VLHKTVQYGILHLLNLASCIHDVRSTRPRDCLVSRQVVRGFAQTLYWRLSLGQMAVCVANRKLPEALLTGFDGEAGSHLTIDR